MKTVADIHRLTACSNKNCWQAFKGYQHKPVVCLLKIDDLERPWIPKIKAFTDFGQFFAAAHTSKMNCDEITKDY